MLRIIDNLADIPLETVKASDLANRGYLHRAESTGSGREKVTHGREGVETPFGDIEIHVWEKAAKAVIHRDGLDEELERLAEFCAGDIKNPSLKQEYYRRAVSMVLTAGYQDPCWYGFIRYNRAFHPEVLETAHLVKIVTECCQLQEKTEEALAMEAKLCDGTLCPSCGIVTAYRRVSDGEGVDANAPADR